MDEEFREDMVFTTLTFLSKDCCNLLNLVILGEEVLLFRDVLFLSLEDFLSIIDLVVNHTSSFMMIFMGVFKVKGFN